MLINNDHYPWYYISHKIIKIFVSAVLWRLDISNPHSMMSIKELEIELRKLKNWMDLFFLKFFNLFTLSEPQIAKLKLIYTEK